jgi:peptidyl-prolyl cis-trans isomerase B (cyclophilin B)
LLLQGLAFDKRRKKSITEELNNKTGGKKVKNLVLASCLVAGMVMADTDVSAENQAPTVEIITNHGSIVIELDPKAAPKTVENFLSYVNDGAYDGTIFHRVIKDFMIQGGGFVPQMVQKKTKEPIANEADNGLKNLRGTIAMARTMEPHSATSQFFINTVDNSFLDHTAKNARGWGYCVFGKVVEGMDTIDDIAKVKTANKMGHQDVPVVPVIIEKVTLKTIQ